MFGLKPDFFINGDICHLDLTKLQDANIQGLILDLDNTIMRPNSANLCEPVIAWLQKLKDSNFKVVIVTNNTKETYLQKVQTILDGWSLKMFTKAAKPRTATLKKSLDFLELPPSQVCIVGDRVLTDVLGGILLGIKTVLIQPLLGKQEILFLRLLRKLEYLCLDPRLKFN